MGRFKGSILVAGGDKDPNLRTIISTAYSCGIDVLPLLIGRQQTPSLTWDLETNKLFVDEQPVTINGVFIRRDVFHKGNSSADYRALAWYTTLNGWLASNPKVRVLNRGYLDKYTNKLHIIRLAQAAGLTVPKTLATNNLDQLTNNEYAESLVVKPVTGGGYCKSLNGLLSDTEQRGGVAASPAIVQQQLKSPDVRIYRIKKQCIGFRIVTDALDYRETHDPDIEPLDQLPNDSVAGLAHLMESMEMDWGAADFKTCPETGELMFLEINSNPMFSVFDRKSNNIISSAIINYLSNSKPI